MKSMPKYTATEMRKHASLFREEAKKGPVMVSYQTCYKSHDFDMVCINKAHYDKLVEAAKK